MTKYMTNSVRQLRRFDCLLRLLAARHILYVTISMQAQQSTLLAIALFS